MKIHYMLSRIIIVVLAVICSFIALINEHITLKLTATVLFGVAAMVTSFLATPISKRIISTGDSIANKYLRVLYYILLLPLILLIVYLLCMLILLIFSRPEHSAELAEALGKALITLFLFAVIFIAFIVPYVQTLIVLLLRKIMKDKTEQ